LYNNNGEAIDVWHVSLSPLVASACECEHNNNTPDSIDARLFSFVVLAVAPVVTMDEATSLLWYHNKRYLLFFFSCML